MRRAHSSTHFHGCHACRARAAGSLRTAPRENRGGRSLVLRGDGRRKPTQATEGSSMRSIGITAILMTAVVFLVAAASAAAGTVVTWRTTTIGPAITTAGGHTLYLFRA